MSLVSCEPFQLIGRYADRNRWEVLNGPGDGRVTGDQVLEDEGVKGQWTDRVVLVTGVSAGIGVQTFEAMAATGATVFGTARNLDKARDALGALLDNERCHLLHMDHTDLASVRACASAFRQQSGGKLNVLICNAAVMNTPYEITKDGFELQFQTNHLAHFLLFYLLQEPLLSASTPRFQSRVVMVSSAAHRYGPCRLDNINLAGEYDGWRAYGSSKTANVYMASQVERRYGGRGVHAYALHPGSFVSPNLQRFSRAEMAAAATDARVRRYLTAPAQACATSVYAAVSAELEGRGGLYLEGAAQSVRPAPPGADAIEYGYAGWAFDPAQEEKLWEESKRWCQVE